MAEISLSNVSSGGGGTTNPGGANTNVQYNDSGSFGGDALFVFDETNTRLGVGVTTPDTTLNIEGPDQCVARFESTGVGGGIDLKDQSTTANNYVGVGALGDNLCFRAGGVAQGLARLFSTGNLVVGSTLSDNGFQIETEDRDASFNGVRVGKGAGSILTNTAVGVNSLASNTSGAENTSNGYFALNQNTTGSFNTAFGGQALQSNISGSSNTAIGRYALRVNTASNNTAIGTEAGSLNTSGTGLTAIGYQALRASTGNNNTALGFEAGLQVSTGVDNILIGKSSASALTTGNGNISIGSNIALTASSIGAVAIGANVSGAPIFNTVSALSKGTSINGQSGQEAVSIGFGSSTGTNSVAIGYFASASGSNSVAIGTNSTAGGFNSSIVLGRSATATAANQFVVGSASYNAGTVTVGAAAQTHYWTIKINGTDYKVLLAL